MLHAILNGKARRVSLENDGAQSWRSLFRQYEDLLTAAFWGRLSYLPEESLRSFISSILNVDTSDWGEFESIIFWPKYDFPDFIDESVRRWINARDRFSEPDVVLNFTHCTLIVEVKPPTGGQQYQEQWCKEIYAWKNGEEAKPKLHFLALGNLPPNTLFLFAELKELFDNLTCHSLEWSTIRSKLQHPDRKWLTQQEQRVVGDCLSALALYGVRESLRPWQPFLQFLSSQTLPSEFFFLQGKQ